VTVENLDVAVPTYGNRMFFLIENVGMVVRSFEHHERNVKLKGYRQMIIVNVVFDRALFLLDYVELLKLL
jgi:hypothetical protein